MISCPEKGGPLKRLRARSTRAGSAAKQWQGRDTRSSVGRDTVPMHLARSPKKIGSLSKRQRPMQGKRGLRTTDLSNCLKNLLVAYALTFQFVFVTFSTRSVSQNRKGMAFSPRRKTPFSFLMSLFAKLSLLACIRQTKTCTKPFLIEIHFFFHTGKIYQYGFQKTV